MKILTVKELYQAMKEDFALSLITHPSTMEKTISTPYLHRPGLAFAGHIVRFSYQRIQILGETEISFIRSLDQNLLYERFKEIASYDIPCFMITKGLSVPEHMEYIADDMKIPIFTTPMGTDKIMSELRKYLNDFFAPSKTIHGTFVDVFGQGILLTGKSGIGKSECALELVERGHRLITDDAVKIKLKSDALIGSSTNEYGHFMEVRGVGLIDVEKMFGIQAVRKEKSLDIQVELMPWRDTMDYERLGLRDNQVDILGEKVPIIYLPISPGKNVSVIIEVISMNHILKMYGYDASKVYTQRLQQDLQKKARIRNANYEEKG